MLYSSSLTELYFWVLESLGKKSTLSFTVYMTMVKQILKKLMVLKTEQHDKNLCFTFCVSNLVKEKNGQKGTKRDQI
jgi:hypothetical protein